MLDEPTLLGRGRDHGKGVLLADGGEAEGVAGEEGPGGAEEGGEGRLVREVLGHQGLRDRQRVPRQHLHHHQRRQRRHHERGQRRPGPGRRA